MKRLWLIFRIVRRVVYAALVVAFVGLAVRGRWRLDWWWASAMQPVVNVYNCADRVDVTFVWFPTASGVGLGHDDFPEDPGPVAWRSSGGDHWSHFQDDLTSRVSIPGVLVRTGLRSTSGSEVPRFDAPLVSVAIPQWLGAALAAMPLAWAAWRWWRRRPAEGMCGQCGYDLRVHRAGERCPECGKEITASRLGDEVATRSNGSARPSAFR